MDCCGLCGVWDLLESLTQQLFHLSVELMICSLFARHKFPGYFAVGSPVLPENSLSTTDAAARALNFGHAKN